MRIDGMDSFLVFPPDYDLPLVASLMFVGPLLRA